MFSTTVYLEAWKFTTVNSLDHSAAATALQSRSLPGAHACLVQFRLLRVHSPHFDKRIRWTQTDTIAHVSLGLALLSNAGQDTHSLGIEY